MSQSSSAPTVIPAGLEFPQTTQLTELQTHLEKLCEHFGWTTVAEKKFLLMVEEMGELAKAIRNREKLFQEKDSPKQQDVQQNLAEEFADVFSYLMDLANHYEIDLGKAYTEKMSANFTRTWK